MKKRLLIAFLSAVIAALALGRRPGRRRIRIRPTARPGVTSPVILALIGNDDSVRHSRSAPCAQSERHEPHASTTAPYASSIARTPGPAATIGRRHVRPAFHRALERQTAPTPSSSSSRTAASSRMPGRVPACAATTADLVGTVERRRTTGSMHGYFIISNVGTQTSHEPVLRRGHDSTNADCTTATFINTHFTPCYAVDVPVDDVLRPLRRRRPGAHRARMEERVG